jgi:maltokinase
MQLRPELTALTEERLEAWMRDRRWFASKGREVAHFRVLDGVPLAEGPPPVFLILVEARFPSGHHDVYQVLAALRPDDEGWDREVIVTDRGSTIYDATADPEACAVIGRLLAEGGEHAGPNAAVRFTWQGGGAPGGPAGALAAEQSNTSIRFGDEVVLKGYRRLEAGENPELEMVRFLADRGFDAMPPLKGWYAYEGELMDATLGVAQAFVTGARDGWELVLDEAASDPDGTVARIGDLGRTIGRMHTVLGSDPSDPEFAPEIPGDETLGLLAATVDEQIDRLFVTLSPDDERVAALAGRGEEVRDRLQLLVHVGVGGRLIRHHGDLHLGQTLLGPDGWVVLDFEGEPARPLLERRRKRSPLRDVAGMLRSFAYAASASELQRGTPVAEDWESRAREAFLAGYLETVDQVLLPAGRAGIETLLSMFELEKAVYELRYELDNRPDWVRIPVAGILRLLDAPLP